MSCCAEHQVLASGSSWFMSLWSSSPYLASALLAPFVLLLVFLYPALVLLTPKARRLPPSASFYSSTESKEPQPLPRLLEEDHDSVQLSIVVPAFNEEERLTAMLDEAYEYIDGVKKSKAPLAGAQHQRDEPAAYISPVDTALSSPLQSYEILIVDDGSRDKTASIALAWAAKKKLGADQFRLVRLERNCGKGKAVRHGVLHARGQLIAFCDADGATRFADMTALMREMARIVTSQGHGIVCGSRAHLVGSDAVVKRSFARNLLMHSFHFILSLLMRPPNPVAGLQRAMASMGLSSLTTRRRSKSRAPLPSQPVIRDTQCGFKLLTRPSARVIFPLAHIDRWIFDVELLLLAEMASQATMSADPAAATRAAGASEEKGQDGNAVLPDPLLRLPLPISEVAVDWKEVAGSKIDILTDSVKMGLDLIVIRLNYALGRWQRPGPLPAVSSSPNCCVPAKPPVNGDVTGVHAHR